MDHHVWSEPANIGDHLALRRRRHRAARCPQNRARAPDTERLHRGDSGKGDRAPVLRQPVGSRAACAAELRQRLLLQRGPLHPLGTKLGAPGTGTAGAAYHRGRLAGACPRAPRDQHFHARSQLEVVDPQRQRPIGRAEDRRDRLARLLRLPGKTARTTRCQSARRALRVYDGRRHRAMAPGHVRGPAIREQGADRRRAVRHAGEG